MIAFQQAHSLAANGIVTALVVRALRLAIAAFENSAPAGKARINPGGTASAPGGAPPLITAMIAAGNRIIDKRYAVGAGHARCNDVAYDCSGAVSYALHGAGLLSAPEDSTETRVSYGGSGPGRWNHDPRELVLARFALPDVRLSLSGLAAGMSGDRVVAEIRCSSASWFLPGAGLWPSCVVRFGFTSSPCSAECASGSYATQVPFRRRQRMVDALERELDVWSWTGRRDRAGWGGIVRFTGDRLIRLVAM